MGKRIFITGVAGFVGAHLARKLLEKGHQVIGLTHHRKPFTTLSLLGIESEVTLIQGDICDRGLMREILAKYYVEDVYHLAAQSIVKVALVDPFSTYNTSCMGTASVLDACRDTGVRAILATSSDKVYGEGLDRTEESTLQPTGAYETAKICMDYMCRSYFYRNDLPVTITRACNIYGEHDLNRRIIPNSLASIRDGKSPIIFKNDYSLREYIYVDDVCEAYIALAENIEKTKGQPFNVGTGEVIDQESLVKKMVEVIKPSLEPVYVDKPPSLLEINQQSINSSKIRQTLEWQPQYGLAQGLARTWERSA